MKNSKLKSIMFGNSVIIFLVMLCFIKPHYLTTINILRVSLIAMSMIFSIVILLLYIARNKINVIDMLIIGYFFVLLLSTLYNNGDLSGYVSQCFLVLVFTLYFRMCLEHNKKRIFSVFTDYFSILSILNFISIILKNNRDANRVYFLGYDNTFAPFLVIGCFIVLIYLIDDNIEKHTWKKYLSQCVFLINLVSALLVTSATIKVGMFMFVLGYALFYLLKLKKIKVLNYDVYFIVSLLIFFLIVIFRMQDNFEYLITNILHRDLTFTGRSYIWDRSLEYIGNNQILGIGYWNMENRLATIGIYHAHSTYLNILLESGIIGMISYFALLFINGRKIKRINNVGIKNVIAFAFFAYFIMTISEVYTSIHLFYVLFIIANIYSLKGSRNYESTNS